MVLLANSSEEEWLDNLLILDTRGVWHDHLRTLVFSIILFGFYGFFLLIICTSRIAALSILLLFSSQVLIGLSATRGYSDLGILTQEKMRFFDSVVTNGSSSLDQVEVNPGNVPLFFERLSFNAQKTDQVRTDDYNDISWFIMVVWSILSTALFSFQLIDRTLCAFLGDLALVLACFLSYTTGYRTRRGTSFEDQVTHLEYHTINRLKTIDEGAREVRHATSLLLQSRLRRCYISDILVEFKMNSGVELEYRMGFPSAEKERFILDAPDNIAAEVKQSLEALPAFASGNWLVEEMKTQHSKILRAVNEKSLDISNSASYVKSPDSLKAELSVLHSILTTIIQEVS